MSDLLILGGTTEARLLCEEVFALGIDSVVSLAGVTSQPAALPVRTRTGGFGGPSGLRDWLLAHKVRCVVDATHPFAATMPNNAAKACEATNLPRLRLLRPAFHRRPGWNSAPDLETALSLVPPGKRVLLTTGRNDLGGIAHRTDLQIYLRSIEPVADVPDHVRQLRISPPLNWDSEHAMLSDHHIDVLIAKDSGGVTAPKLEVASSMGVQVILIERPPQPTGPIVATVDEAVAWLLHEVAIGIR